MIRSSREGLRFELDSTDGTSVAGDLCSSDRETRPATA